MLLACSGSLKQDQSRKSTNLALSRIDHRSPPSDMDKSWQEVGEQLRLETVFFNRDPPVLFGFLYRIEPQDAHPVNVHNAFKGFFGYLEEKG